MKYINRSRVALTQVVVVETEAHLVASLGRLEVVEATSDLDYPSAAQAYLSVVQAVVVVDDQFDFVVVVTSLLQIRLDLV